MTYKNVYDEFWTNTFNFVKDKVSKRIGQKLKIDVTIYHQIWKGDKFQWASKADKLKVVDNVLYIRVITDITKKKVWLEAPYNNDLKDWVKVADHIIETYCQ